MLQIAERLKQYANFHCLLIFIRRVVTIPLSLLVVEYESKMLSSWYG